MVGVLLKACLNGDRRSDDHPAVPQTPAALATDARCAVAAGADAIHLHVYGTNGIQSLDPDDCAAAIGAVRVACPGVPVGLSTVAIAEPDPARRHALVAAWTVMPDFVSVNLGEAGSGELCAMLFTRGIGVEAGLATIAEADDVVRLAFADRCLRLLLEPAEQDAEAALDTVAGIEAVLDAAGIRIPRLLHGFDATAWPVLDAAVARGLDTRIGLEDTILRPDGQPARDNAELVVIARAWIAARSASPDPPG